MDEQSSNDNNTEVTPNGGILSFFEINEIIVFAFIWIIGACTLFSNARFGKSFLAMLLYTIGAPFLIKFGNGIRKVMAPDVVIADSMSGSIGKRLFWSIGPQTIAAIITVAIAAKIVGIRL